MDGLIWSIMKNTSTVRRTAAALAVGGAVAATMSVPAANAADSADPNVAKRVRCAQ